MRGPITARFQLARTAAAAALGLALTQAAAAGPIEGTAPYPASTYITDLAFDWSTFRRDGISADNWPLTWAGNGNLYTSFGDGGGFGKDSLKQAYVSIGVARVTGSSAKTLKGRNLIGGASPLIATCFPVLPGAVAENRTPKPGKPTPCRKKGLHGKSRSLLALGNTLYMFITPEWGVNGMNEARLYRAPLESNDWERADWAVSKDDPYPLVTPTFMQAGKNQADIGDYIHAYAARYAPLPDATVGKYVIQRGPKGGEIVLMRAAKTANLMQERNWEYYAGSTGLGPQWSHEASDSVPVFRDPNGVGFANAGIYVKALKRYLLVTLFDKAYAGKFGVFEARAPWGPWSTVFYGAVGNSAKGVPANGFFANFMPSAFSADGKAFSFVFTGQGKNDALNVLDGRFTLNPAGR